MSRSDGLTTLRMIGLDLGDVIVAHFQPSAAGHAHVDDELAGIGARKVGAAEERKEHEQRQRYAAQNRSGRETGTPHRAFRKAFVPGKQWLELLVELRIEAC